MAASKAKAKPLADPPAKPAAVKKSVNMDISADATACTPQECAALNKLVDSLEEALEEFCCSLTLVIAAVVHLFA